MHRVQSIVTAAVLAASMLFGTAPVQADTLLTTVPGVVVSRISGSNRYETACAIAVKAFQSSVSEAVLVSGANFPDALAASGYAGMKKCPVLITAPDTLSSPTQKFIQTKKIKKITIIGGTSAVSSAVENKLVSTCGIPQTSITRIKGNNRRETAEEVEKAGGFARTGACVVTSGRTPADALSISPWCYKNKWPIFLTDGDGNLSAAALDAAKSYAHVYILGSTKSVSAATASALPNSERIEGKNRYETSVKIASKFAAGYNNTLVASGQNTKFADALSGAMLAGLTNVPIILADSKTDAGTTLMKDKAASISRIYVLGSANSVSDLVIGTIKGIKYNGIFTLDTDGESYADLNANNDVAPDHFFFKPLTDKYGQLTGLTFEVNGMSGKVTLPGIGYHVKAYAADLNIADHTKNVILQFAEEDTVGALCLYAYDDSSLKLVKTWGITTENKVNSYNEGEFLTDRLEGNGIFQYVIGENFGARIDGKAYSMHLLNTDYIFDTTLTKNSISSGYFKNDNDHSLSGFVQPFTFHTVAPISLYKDAACTKLSGSIPGGKYNTKYVSILGYRTDDNISGHNLYVSVSGGSKGWVKRSDLSSATVYGYYGYS